MSTHQPGHDTSHAPERDLLAEDIHTTFAALPLPSPGIDLSGVRRRGRRRHTLHQTLIAAPIAAVVLAGGAVAWHPWSSSTLTPAQQHTSQPAPAPTASQTPRPADPHAIATTALQDAILTMDADLDAPLTVETSSNTDSGQVLGWSTSYLDERSAPPALFWGTILGATQDEYSYGNATGCTIPTQCVEEELPGDLKLVTSTESMVLQLHDGAQLAGTHTKVSAVYPDGRIVTAETTREATAQADLGPERSFDSPLITAEDLRTLVTDPALAEVPWPTPASTPSP